MNESQKYCAESKKPGTQVYIIHDLSEIPEKAEPKRQEEDLQLPGAGMKV